MQRRRKCLFCKNIADDREHLWPDWIIQLLSKAPHQPVNVAGHIDGKTYSYESQLGIKAKCVCRECNNGWMCDLEVSAQHIVGPLIQDISIRLDEGQQETISRWAFKTSMVLESITRSRSRDPQFYTDEECQQLRASSSLPSRSLVWLGRYSGRYEIACIGSNIWSNVPGKPGTIHGYVSTIVAGTLAIQLLTFHVPNPYGDRTVSIQPRPGLWPEFLLGIRPFRKSLYWPPQNTIKSNGRITLDMLSNRWSKGIYPPVES